MVSEHNDFRKLRRGSRFWSGRQQRGKHGARRGGREVRCWEETQKPQQRLDHTSRAVGIQGRFQPQESHVVFAY